MNSIGGNRAVNITASLVTVQEHGQVWPCAKVDCLPIVYFILFSWIAHLHLEESVLSCTTCTKWGFVQGCMSRV